MKLAILLLGLPVALGYIQNYEGFNKCGVEGWSCGYATNGKLEITYTCPYGQQGARVWIWTARLPPGATIFTVKNCRHLEVHLDCTKGLRSSILSEFRVINVGLLEFLTPMLPGVFLHDNDYEPQAPPSLYIEDVEETDFYPGMFDKPNGACRYKQLEIRNLTINHVRRLKLRRDLFRNQNFASLSMKNVRIQSMEFNSMVVNGNISIMNSTFPKLPSNAISLKGKNISFINNTIEKIPNLGLSARCKNFEFLNNEVGEIGTQGLNVMATHVSITNNSFKHLEPGAFQGIGPGYSPHSYEMAVVLTYNFSNNNISTISPGSLDPDWETYLKVCSQLTFKKNVIECSCLNLGWMSVSNGLGPKLSKAKEFYDLYIETEVNMCNGFENCPLNAIVPHIQDICNNKTNVAEICNQLQSLTKKETTKPTQDSTSSDPTQKSLEETSMSWLTTQLNEITEKFIPVLSYTENQTSYIEERAIPIWVFVVPIIAVMAAISSGIFVWWYKKKKQRQAITTVYKNKKGHDADNLLVFNEHHNELYDRQ